jgi:DNA-binding transcriptional LysR family regulator
MAKNLSYKGIQLAQLRSFSVVANRANFTEAADILGLSVPAVWQQVRSLEREVGAPLLQRHGRAVTLTPEGKLLAELVQPYVSGLESLIDQFQERRGGLPKEMTLATTFYVASFHLVEPVREFLASHPSVRLSLLTGMGGEPVEMMARRQAQLAIVGHHPEEPRHPHMDYEDLFAMDFTLLTPRGHPLARKKKVTPADLVRYPHIITPKSGFAFRRLERLLQRHGLFDALDVAMDCRYTDLILKYVGLGLGIALVYISDRVRRTLDQVHARVFDASLGKLHVALVTRKHYHLSEPMQVFRNLLRKHTYDEASLSDDRT